MYLCLSEQNISKLENLPNNLNSLDINNNKFIYKCNVNLKKYILKLYISYNKFQIKIIKNQLIYF